MKRLSNLLLLPTAMLLSCGSQSQNLPPESILVGGPCEGCDGIFEYGDRVLSSTDTLPDFGEEGQQLKITGTVYLSDGTTPAEGVIIYLYHANPQGIYAKRGNETGWARRHGYIRGWVKTDAEGQYSFYTLLPGTYPERTEAAHIHPTILEPNGKYYWVGSYYFAGDPLLTEQQLAPRAPRGGTSGIVTLESEGAMLTGSRDFILGRNIPDYE